MGRDISRNAGNINEKFNNKDWMVMPKFSEVSPTCYVNVSNVSVHHDHSISEFENMDITEMLTMAVEKMK